MKNTSHWEGDEVVQLYLNFPKLAGAPLRVLRGFARAHLGPEETQHVHFAMSSRDLSLVNDAGDRLVAAGAYRVRVGGGPARDSRSRSGNAIFHPWRAKTARVASRFVYVNVGVVVSRFQTTIWMPLCFLKASRETARKCARMR